MQAWEQVDFFKNLKRLRTSQYTGLVKVEEFENISVSDIKNGDILYRIQAKDNDTAVHIGIVFKRPEDADLELTMFQSSGRPYIEGCTYNLHENDHGPIQKKLNNGNLNDYFEVVDGQSGYARVLRITADTNWVDLGFQSGILWATRNVGANSPEELGYYVEWNNLASAEAEWVQTVGCSYWQNLLGSGCHTPTKEDWQKLIDSVPSEWKTQNGVNGRLFTASNGNKLFLPAAGFLHEGGIYNVGEYGIYWTSTSSDNPNNAWYARFNSNPDEKPVLREYLRLFGLSVRPVLVIPSNKD